MSLSIESSPEQLPHRIMTYGVPGVGKTWWAASAPGAVFIPTEDGLTGLDVPRFPLATNYEQVLQYISELYTEQHDFKHLVIDTADWLEQLIWRHICNEHGKQSISDFDWGKGYAAAVAYLSEVLAGLDAVRKTKGMGVIILAHAKTERFEDPDHSAYDRYTPKMHRDFTAKLIEWCDDVFFCNYRTHTKEVDSGHRKTKTKAMGSGERVMRTSAKPTAIAKNRIGLPDEIEMSWDALWSQSVA